jgi:hypothetical protein
MRCTIAPMPQHPGSVPIVTYDEIARAYYADKPAIDAEIRRQAASGALSREDASRLEASFAEALEELQRHSNGEGVMGTAPHPLASALQSLLAKKAADARQLEETPSGIPQARFDNGDILNWIRTGLVSLFRRKFDWVQAPGDPDPLPRPNSDNLRVAVFGDWGTGMYGAPVIADSIEKDPGVFDMVLHLGDVYYSGQPDEVRKQLVEAFPYRPDAIHRSLNGNHEMYSGGEAYIDSIRQPKFSQRASYFYVETGDWLLAGLDTAYEDHSLTDDQVSWLSAIVAGAGQRKVILFSHHQPFSLLDQQGPKLVEKLRPILASGRIFAWYWGHEHRCVLYDRHPQWGLQGRCVGHGGFPYYRDNLGARNGGVTWRRMEANENAPGAEILDGPNPYVKENPSKYGPHGYVTLVLQGAELRETVHNADGTVLRTNVLSAQQARA